MARTSQRSVLADRQQPAQPALFDDQDLPVEAAALESIRTRRHEHQGIRLTEDDTKAQRLVELITLKWGVKKISRDMHISPHTVRAARRLLVSQGKVAPYKQRVVEMMKDVIEQGVGNYLEALKDGRVPAAQIPVGVAIMFDKRALAMGEPTSIRSSLDAPSDELKVEAINAYLENLPSAKTVASDSVSTENPSKPQQTAGNAALDVTLDVSQVQPAGAPSTRLDGGLAAAGAATEDPTRQPGGGGGAAAGAAD